MATGSNSSKYVGNSYIKGYSLSYIKVQVSKHSLIFLFT